MPIISIIQQPASGSINAAYRPVVVTARATASNGDAKPPVVYCDIYFGSVFYKTLSKSQYTTLNSTDSDWQFDIQDACQEYFRYHVGLNGGHSVESGASLVVSVFCKFRSSGINTNGFIDAEGLEPTQATGGTVSSPGTGTQTNTFIVVNSTLQNEDNQDLSIHLNSFKAGTWNSGYFPLTHRPIRYKICLGDSDYFPIIKTTSAPTFTKLCLNYVFIGQSTVRQSVSNITPFNVPVYYIPNGPKNITTLFPLVNISDVEQYFIQGLASDDTVLFTTTINEISKCCQEDKIRIHFMNYLGTVDAINFQLMTKEHEPKSTSWERPLKAPLDKTVHAINRSNVKSNETSNAVSIDYSEADMDWITELFDSSLAWKEWAGTQGQADSYIPITITDKSFVTKKEDDRYTYELAVKFKLSHEKILIRN